ncbi:CLUMA_CG019790, isoform A [Clunio marinus]|uniref:CLUMA_CG019790, isoform A n=1 Tax=Clunio marinus TaxID=568069 RepID=A0A1J1J4D2_9DIPT|nr:CLUMA_CG019790, isoform A [Clunio marinus]
MLTVKKFAALFNLSVGGYVAGLADDESKSSLISNILASTTPSSDFETTTDDDENDDDEPIPGSERRDEINDSKLKTKNLSSKYYERKRSRKRKQTIASENVYF